MPQSVGTIWLVTERLRNSPQLRRDLAWPPASASASPAAAPRVPARRHSPDWVGYGSAVAATAAATAVGWLLYHGPRLPDESRRPLLADANVLMVYLLVVLWVATRHSRSAAVLASIIGVAAFDFCFVPPYLTFVVSNRQYTFTFAAMLVAALVISGLTHRVRAQALDARKAWEWAEAEFL